MVEGLDIPIHEPKIIEHLEIGGGRVRGVSIYDVSPSVRSAIDGGASALTVDREIEGLSIPRYGSVRKEAMQVFANSSYLNGRVRNIYLNNVCSERDSGIEKVFPSSATRFFSALKNKLTSDGKIVVVENYTPSESAFLKSIDYRAFGIHAEITQSLDEYRSKLRELDMQETKIAEEFAQKYATEYGIPWEPFVMVLTLAKDGPNKDEQKVTI